MCTKPLKNDNLRFIMLHQNVPKPFKMSKSLSLPGPHQGPLSGPLDPHAVIRSA